MNRAEFTDFVKSVFENDILKLNEEKGNDYAGSADVFRNFSENGTRLGLHPFQVWAVYFSKHIDAIITFTKDGSVKSEPIEGRIDDAIMYLLLLRVMVASENQSKLTESVIVYGKTETEARTAAHRKSDELKAAGTALKCTCPPYNTAHSAACPMSIYSERVKRGAETDDGANQLKPSPKPRS